jgi:hypothetical protein
MEVIGKGPLFRVWACAVLLSLSGCSGMAQEGGALRPVDLGATVDPATYAGDVTFRFADSLVAGDQDIPVALLLGLAPEAETRLGANALVDLRHLQQALPQLLSGPIEASCALGLDILFHGAQAESDALRARASLTARLYTCSGRGTENEQRGMRLLAPTIDVDATLSAGLEGDCIAFRLDAFDLAPRGLIGGLANLFGVTKRARAALLEQARTALAANPVCPDLPEALALLDPHFSALGLREIGAGGIGAALSGSVEISAENIVHILALADPQGSDTEGQAAPPEGQASFRIDTTAPVAGTEISSALDLRLAAVAPTRIGVEARLDLRNLQGQLPELLKGTVLLDSCGSRIALQHLETEAQESRVIARGRLLVENFDCQRTGPQIWERGVLLNAEEFGVRAEMSTEIVEGCVVFRLIDITRDPPTILGQPDGRMDTVRALLLDATRLLLEDSRLCPTLPPEFAALDPRLERVAPEEIGEGGIGIALDGEIDLSPGTIVSLLRVLQDRGAAPPRP